MAVAASFLMGFPLPLPELCNGAAEAEARLAPRRSRCSDEAVAPGMGDREEVMCRVRTPPGLNGVVTRSRRSSRGSGSRLSRGGRRRFVDAHSSRRDAVVAAAAHSSLRAERQRRWLSGWRPRECGPLRARLNRRQQPRQAQAVDREASSARQALRGALPLAHPGIFEPKSCWFSRIGSRRDTLEHQPVRQ